MKRLLIIGAGGFGREVFAWAADVNLAHCRWEKVAFLDGNPNALVNFSCPANIIGDPGTYIPTADDQFVCAIGNPLTKLTLCRSLKARGAEFATLVHPTAVAGLDCRLGEGCILCPGAILTTNVSLGNFVTVNLQATVGHDAVVGDGCTLSCHCDVTGHAALGQGVFLGSHASILPGATVGEFAIVGAGSVVLRKVHPNTTVMGVPAKQLVVATQSRAG